MTTLTYRFARTLADGWAGATTSSSRRLDHDANVRPWVQLAARTGVEVRWAEADLDDRRAARPGSTTASSTSAPALVAVTAASNVLGTRPDVRAITDLARARGALSYVDGVHSTAHGVTDVAAYGCDFYATSAYKWAGPHVGCVVADPALLEGLRPEKLASSADEVPRPLRVGHAVVREPRGRRGGGRPPGRPRRRGDRVAARAARHLAGRRPRSTTRSCSRACWPRSTPTPRDHAVRPGRRADVHGLPHGRRSHPERGGHARSPRRRQRLGRPQLRLGDHRRRSASATRAARSGPASTTTPPTTTSPASSRPSTSLG